MIDRVRSLGWLGTWAGGRVGVGHMRCSRAAEAFENLEQRLSRRKHGHPFANGPLTVLPLLPFTHAVRILILPAQPSIRIRCIDSYPTRSGFFPSPHNRDVANPSNPSSARALLCGRRLHLLAAASARQILYTVSLAWNPLLNDTPFLVRCG